MLPASAAPTALERRVALRVDLGHNRSVAGSLQDPNRSKLAFAIATDGQAESVCFGFRRNPATLLGTRWL